MDEDLILLMKQYNTPEEKRDLLAIQQIRLLKKIEAAILSGQPAIVKDGV